jgi:uncharacterized membrane protein
VRAFFISAVVVLLAVLYSVAVHVLVTQDNRTILGVLFAVVSGGSTLLVMVWSAGWRARLAVLAGALITGVLGAKMAGTWDPRWVYLVQHAGIHALLGAYFVFTLRPGKTAIITRMASLVRKSMNDEVRAYTRKVTAIWVGYFFGMAGLSITLFVSGLVTGNMMAWSILSNALTWPAVAILACGEYIVRRKRFPNDEHMSLWENLKMSAKVNPRDF